MTTLTSLTRLHVLVAPAPLLRGFLLGFLGTLTIGILLLVGASLGVAVTHAERIMPGVRAGGVEVGDLTRAAAKEKLLRELPSLTDGSVSVHAAGATVRIQYAELAPGYDLDAMVGQAFAVARNGSPLGDGIARLRSLVHASSITPSVSLDDTSSIDRIASELVARFTVAPLDASVTYDAGAGFLVHQAAVGRRLDVASVRRALTDIVAAPRTNDANLELTSEAVQPQVTTEHAARAALSARRMTSFPLVLQTDETSFSLTPADLAALVRFAQGRDGYRPAVDRSALAAVIEPLAPSLAQEPMNARFAFDTNGVSGIVPGVIGRELDVNASISEALATLEMRAAGTYQPWSALVVISTQPALTNEAATALVPRLQRLSTWTTNYVPGEGNFWGANISIPAHDINGLVVAPGDSFDFWDDIGPVTVERGYGSGGAIIGGRSVANGALAGGICSTSTTLFNAAMQAGLEIGERRNHYYYISRYPTGLDATVYQTDSYEVNMTFRNDTANPIVIRSYTGSGFVRFDIWGVPDGRTVSLTAPITTNHRAARDTVVVNSGMAPGTSRRVEYPHDGFDAVVTRTVRDADGNVLWLNVWESSYRPVSGITEVGPSIPATPAPSTPPPSPFPSPSPSPQPST